MDGNCVFEALAQMRKLLARDQYIESFALLERKGPLCTYEFDDRNILCFTELIYGKPLEKGVYPKFCVNSKCWH